MMIKRLMALIALVSPIALAQQQPGDGNVPAPNLFDDQIRCSNRLSTMVPTPSIRTGEMSSQLDTLIEAGEIPYADDGGQYPGAEALQYIIPPTGPDCGSGEAGDANFDGIDDDDFSPADGAVYDVSKVYMEAYDAFREVVAAEDILQVRQDRLDLERRLATETSPNTEDIAEAQEAVDAAADVLNGRQAELDTLATGPITRTGIAEWRAANALNSARLAWNRTVRDVEDSQRELDGAEYGEYVDLPDKRITSLRNAGGTINYGNLVNYVSFNTQGVSGSDNFDDDTGNLIVPIHDHDSDPETPDVPVTVATTVATIRNHIEAVDEAVEALEKAVADNPNPLRTAIYEDGLRRAKVEQAHWQEQWRNALADNTDMDTNTDGEQSIRRLSLEHTEAIADRTVAEADLRVAVAAREAATQDVIDEFHSAGSFFDQWVARRQYLKNQADDVVTEAGEDSTQAQIDAAAAAATALEDAERMRDRYVALVEDPDNPVGALMDELLTTDGDDGQAIVDAISATYEKTTDNRDAIAALTADTDDGAEADGPITANRKAIDANAGEIESLGGRVTQNETDIDTLMEDTEMNAAMISTNTGYIATNSTNIAANASNISVNAGNIVANTGHIGRNVGNISRNFALIDRNAGHIALNSERIGANAAAIGMNSGLIADNRHLIGELNSDLDIVRAGVAASIALSRMPSIDGGGISFGAGTFAGEMAYAVGFQVKRNLASFDIGVTSSGGEIGAGVGVGVKFWD